MSDHKVEINNLIVTTSCFIMSKMCFQVYYYPHTYIYCHSYLQFIAIATCKNCFIIIVIMYVCSYNFSKQHLNQHMYSQYHYYYAYQGRIQDFLKGGSESGVDIEGGANPSIVSLKQGVWGAQLPRSYGVFNFG